MSKEVHSQFNVQVYYEDTDHSGVVYHANYLRYFERAREHLLGVEALVKLLKEEQTGFVVYTANLTYKKGAEFGDNLLIETIVTRSSPYRLVFKQKALLKASGVLLVEADIELVCVNEKRQLVKLPKMVLEALDFT
jgi:tol-pal system-associated acyl-CoA thioesterase